MVNVLDRANDAPRYPDRQEDDEEEDEAEAKQDDHEDDKCINYQVLVNLSLVLVGETLVVL